MSDGCLFFCDIIKQGYLRVKGRKNLGIWKNQWVVLRKASSTGPLRLDRYASESAAEQRGAGEAGKEVRLDGVRSIELLPPDKGGRHPIRIWTSGDAVGSRGGSKNAESYIQLASDMEQEAQQWHDTLGEAKAAYENEKLAGLDFTMFHVYLLPTPTFTFYGELLLKVTDVDVRLLDPATRNALVAWPLNVLRRYSRDANKLTLETGRACKTGEGLFVFNNRQSEEIYQCICRASLALINNGPPASPPPLLPRPIATLPPHSRPTLPPPRTASMPVTGGGDRSVGGPVLLHSISLNEEPANRNLQRTLSNVRPLPPVPGPRV